jgi:hypothetical protein
MFEKPDTHLYISEKISSELGLSKNLRAVKRAPCSMMGQNIAAVLLPSASCMYFRCAFQCSPYLETAAPLPHPVLEGVGNLLLLLTDSSICLISGTHSLGLAIM